MIDLSRRRGDRGKESAVGARASPRIARGGSDRAFGGER